MPAAKSPCLQSHLEKLQQLTTQLSKIGFILPGTVYSRYMPCGKAGCRCQANPPQLHGPYWEWSRSLAGRTISRRLSQPQVRLYQEWIANRRRLSAIIAEIEDLSTQAAETSLHEDGPTSQSRTTT
jgi:uncharacterized protein DUF6788